MYPRPITYVHMGVLLDFGVSKTLTTAVPQAASFVGTAMYMSPERMKGELYSACAFAPVARGPPPLGRLHACLGDRTHLSTE